MTTSEIITLLQARGFRFTHSLGQNFLIDEDVLEEIVTKAAVSGRNVLEIGAGAGCLTQALAREAGRVLAIEIDDKLMPVLNTVLAPQKNVTLVQGDALKLNLEQLTRDAFGGEPFDVVANLPYYITTPVLFRLLEGELPIERICVMLQKEAGARVTARPGAKEYGPLAIQCAYRADIETIVRAAPHCFVPQPHVESEVIAMDMRPYRVQVDEKAFMRMVKACFLMRRKTLVNNLMAYGLSRGEAEEAVKACSLPPAVRAEALDLDQFLALFGEITHSGVLPGRDRGNDK